MEESREMPVFEACWNPTERIVNRRYWPILKVQSVETRLGTVTILYILLVYIR
jgi:hypothetical protein